MPTEESSHDPFGLLEPVATSLGRHFYTYVLQPDGTFETIFGIGAASESFLGAPTPVVDDDAAWVAAVHPDDRPLYECLDEPIRRGEAVDAQYRLIGVDGRTGWVEVHERARSRGDGKIVVDGVVSDITARKKTELALQAALRKADRIARVDGLTGAYNRRHVTEVLDAELTRAARSGEPLGLLLLDLDHFKRVNDHHGHGGGDEVLRETVIGNGMVTDAEAAGAWSAGADGAATAEALHPSTRIATAGSTTRRLDDFPHHTMTPPALQRFALARTGPRRACIAHGRARNPPMVVRPRACGRRLRHAAQARRGGQ